MILNISEHSRLYKESFVAMATTPNNNLAPSDLPDSIKHK